MPLGLMDGMAYEEQEAALVCGLLEPTGGYLTVAGKRAADGRLASCAYMPQRDLLLPWLSALDNAALAPRNRGATRAEARERARPLFERFGLADFEGARPAELSGGMRQMFQLMDARGEKFVQSDNRVCMSCRIAPLIITLFTLQVGIGITLLNTVGKSFVGLVERNPRTGRYRPFPIGGSLLVVAHKKGDS